MVALSHQSPCRADAPSRQPLDERRRTAVEWRAVGGGMEGGGMEDGVWRQPVEGVGRWVEHCSLYMDHGSWVMGQGL